MKEGKLIWSNVLEQRESKLLRDCIGYSDDPSGLPGHGLMLLASKLAGMVERLHEMNSVNGQGMESLALITGAELSDLYDTPVRAEDTERLAALYAGLGNYEYHPKGTVERLKATIAQLEQAQADVRVTDNVSPFEPASAPYKGILEGLVTGITNVTRKAS